MGREPFLCQSIDEVRKVPDVGRMDIRNLIVKRLRIFSPQQKFQDRPVLILTRSFDPEADLVSIKLLSRGLDCIRLNAEDIPRDIVLKYTIMQDTDDRTELKIKNEGLDISKVSVGWIRHFDTIGVNFGMAEPARTFSFQQWDNAIQTLVRTLNCKWVNAPSAISEANDRRNQLMTAKACGFDIPSTIITNDPQTAKDFYYSYNCNIIVKALHSHAVELGGDMYCMFSRSLSEEDLVRINDLVYAPCILQEKVQKKSEMRVTVVGDKVFAAVMKFSSESKRSEDIHRCSPNDVTLEAYRELRPVIIEKCIRFIKSLGLRYGAIDFVVDKNDNLVFLEVNPAGDWNWIEQKTRLPITTAMAALIEELA